MKFPRLRAVWLAILGFVGCHTQFQDTTIQGVPNLVQYMPGMWRMGQPEDANAWAYVNETIGQPGKKVLVVKLNDDNEGSDDTVLSFKDWTLAKEAMPPEDDKPWTVFVKPDPNQVSATLKMMIQAHNDGWIVVHHCTHGRDRTSLIAAMLLRKLAGYTKQQAWDDMIAHGFRWELPDLDLFWLEDVQAHKIPVSKLN